MEHLHRLFDKFVPKVLDFRRHHCKELIPTSELNAVVSLCVLFDALATEENGVSDNISSHGVIEFRLETFCTRYRGEHLVSRVVGAPSLARAPRIFPALLPLGEIRVDLPSFGSSGRL